MKDIPTPQQIKSRFSISTHSLISPEVVSIVYHSLVVFNIDSFHHVSSLCFRFSVSDDALFFFLSPFFSFFFHLPREAVELYLPLCFPGLHRVGTSSRVCSRHTGRSGGADEQLNTPSSSSLSTSSLTNTGSALLLPLVFPPLPLI